VNVTLLAALGSFAFSEASADNSPIPPADPEECPIYNSGHDKMFDGAIGGLGDWKVYRTGDCVHQSLSMWTVLDCKSGRTLDIVTYRSDPIKWDQRLAVNDVSETAMIYREALRAKRMPVSLDLVRNDMLALGADVTERTIADTSAFCAQN
jgi:hypothetical protein